MSAWQSFKFIFSRMRWPIIGLILLVIISGSLEGVGLALFMPLLKLMIDGTQSQIQLAGHAFSLAQLLTFVIIVFAIKNSLLYLQKAMTAKSALNFENELRNGLMASAYYSSWPMFTKNKAGSLVNITLNQLKLAADCLRILVLLSSEIVHIIACCLVGFIISPAAFLTSFIVGAVLFFMSQGVIFKSKGLGLEALKLRNEGVSNVLEDVAGMKFIKGNSVEKHRFEEASNFFKSVTKAEYKAEKLSALMQTLPDFFMITTACLILGVSNLVLHVPGQNLLVLLMVLYRMNKRLAEAQVLRQRLAIYLPSLQQCLEITQSLKDNTEEHKGRRFETLSNQIEFKNTSFAYEKRKILDNVSLVIKKNEFIAVTGRSGSGKTTFLDLLLGLMNPGSGDIFIDGVKMSQMDVSTWRQRIAYLSQEVWLVNGTILSNLLLFNPTASMDDVRVAVKAAHAQEFIEQLSDKYNTSVGDRAFKLSGGQKQRIALARAFLRKPELLILDEATSALDSESESIIHDALKLLKGKTTIVVVAHRSSTVASADTVYEIEGGAINKIACVTAR